MKSDEYMVIEIMNSIPPLLVSISQPTVRTFLAEKPKDIRK